MKQQPYGWYVFLLLWMISSCKNEDKQVVQGDTYYLDYQVHATEGNDNLNVLLQFREGNEKGEALKIGSDGLVRLDNEIMKADSSKRGGVYYEAYKEIGGFEGAHEISFSRNGNTSAEKFNFTPLVLLTAIPDSIRREDLMLEFSGISEGDEIRVILSDTSFAGNGVNITDQSGSARVWLRAIDLANLASGPVQLEIIRETTREMENGTGGRLLITYTIRRQFNLTN